MNYGGDNMIELTNENIHQELSKNPTLVVDFGAEWCGSCQELEPAFKNISKEVQRATFGKVDLAKDETLATKFNISFARCFGWISIAVNAVSTSAR